MDTFFFQLHHCFSCTLGQSTIINFMKKSKCPYTVNNTVDPTEMLRVKSNIDKRICSILG